MLPYSRSPTRGAWIEIHRGNDRSASALVAPHAGGVD